MTKNKLIEFREHFNARANAFGGLFVEVFHTLALFAIGAIIAWAAVHAFLVMIATGQLKIDGILTLFIYLELGAMVGIYFKTNHMPVRYLIYVAITALTRLMISDISHHESAGLVQAEVGAQIGMQVGEKILLESGAILLLALAVLIVRFASSKYPSNDDEGDQ